MSDLLASSRLWVEENYGRSAEHLLKTEEWLRQIEPTASETLLLAALTHDMERAFPGPDSPELVPSRGPDDPIYNQAHMQRSARIVGEYLRGQQAPEAMIVEVARLIAAHEFGGWPEANLVQAADSLSFLEVNIDFFLKRMEETYTTSNGWTPDYVRAKFDWMYERIQVPRARSLAAPLYESAMGKFRQKAEILR